LNRTIFETFAWFTCALALTACGPRGRSVSDPAPSSKTTSSIVAGPVLSFTAAGATHKFSATELLARPDAAAVSVQRDAGYAKPMNYRGVPLRSILSELPLDVADTLQIRATDGFVVQLPRTLLNGTAVPWIAVEDRANPWPALPGHTASAGPFYLVWQNAEQAGISPEQWPYQMAEVTMVSSPMQRWPAIAVDSAVAPNAPARRGQAVFIANCLPCHRLAGNGEGTVGPDLLKPMPATAYLTEAGLRALIRNPAAVRTWPQQRMPGFEASVIGDTDIVAAIAYLRYVAARAGGPASDDTRQQ